MEDLEKYYKKLCDAYDLNEWYYTQNKDRAHNATVMRVMLEKSSDISMYCGEMSVFRKGFYRHINEIYTGKGDELKEHVSSALKNFIEKDRASLRIIVENFKDEILNDLIIPREEFATSLAVSIYQLPDEIGNKRNLPHIAFTTDERMVRLELNKITHQALCKIGTGYDGEKVSPIFNRLLKLARPVAG